MRYLPILLIFYTYFLSAQNNDAFYDCPTSSYYFSELFQEYYSDDKLDSAQIVLNYWMDRCGEREVTMRAYILLEYKMNQLSHFTLPENMLDYLKEYVKRDSITGMRKKWYYEYNRPLYCYIPIDEAYDQFTKFEFSRIQNQKREDINLVVVTYGGNGRLLYENLKSEKYKETYLASKYKEKIEKLEPFSRSHFSILAGYWIPLNLNSILGAHPEIGFQIGSKKQKWNFDLTIAFRFLKSKNIYLAKRKETNMWEETDHFFGGYFGVDVG